VVTTFSTKKAAQSWIDEHQEYIGPKYLFRMGHLDVFEGGGMVNSLREAELRLVRGA
jgi:hypothetical protein